METISDSWLTLLLIAWFAIVILGAILGVKQRITVFRNYNDLGVAFLITLSPVALGYIFSFVTGGLDTLAIYGIIGVETLLLGWIVIRTFQDNNSLLLTLVAFITKMSLSFLFIINFLNFVAPRGETMAKRASVRHLALTFLLVVTPMVFTLVKKPEGLFNPRRVMEYRGLSS
jgi:hypothetical protein